IHSLYPPRYPLFCLLQLVSFLSCHLARLLFFPCTLLLVSPSRSSQAQFWFFRLPQYDTARTRIFLSAPLIGHHLLWSTASTLLQLLLLRPHTRAVAQSPGT